jgi:hypothetical protein
VGGGENEQVRQGHQSNFSDPQGRAGKVGEEMSRSPINLGLHRNTVAGRTKRALAKEFGNRVEAMIRENDIRCAAFIGIAEDGRAFTHWDTGGLIPLYGFPETMGAILRTSVETSGSEEDYKAPIQGGRFKREVKP